MFLDFLENKLNNLYGKVYDVDFEVKERVENSLLVRATGEYLNPIDETLLVEVEYPYIYLSVKYCINKSSTDELLKNSRDAIIAAFREFDQMINSFKYEIIKAERANLKEEDIRKMFEIAYYKRKHHEGDI